MGKSGFPATARPALVGRESELAFLEKWLERGLAGGGGVVAVAGETGTGKTRLVEAVAEEAEKRRMRCWRSAAQPERSGMDCGLFLEALRSLLEHGPRQQRRELRQAIEELAPHLGEALFPRRRRRGKPPSGEMPREWRLNLFCARLVHCLLEAARQRPLVLCLEDLHWADARSLQVLRRLCRKSAAAPLVILCTYRPEESQPALTGSLRELHGQFGGAQLELGRLAEAQTRALVNAWLVRAELGEELLERLHRHSGGVPLFVRQYLERLVEQGVVHQSGPLWVDAPQEEDPEVPDGVREALWRRARELSPEDRQLLSCAAVQGVEFKGKLVAQVLGRSTTEVVRALGRLARTTRLLEMDEDGFCFAHALLREFFYELLAASQQRTAHLQIARLLERSQGGNAALLAGHLSRAGAPALAAPHLLAAAGQARAAADYRGARQWLRQAAEALEHAADRAGRLEVLVELAELEERSGEWHGAEMHCLEAMFLWERQDGEEAPARVALQLGRVRRARGEAAQAGAFYREAMARFAASGNEAASAQVRLELGSLALEGASLEEARSHLEAARAWALRRGAAELLGGAEHRLGQLAGMGGQYLEAVLHCTEALRTLRAAGDAYGLCQTYHCLGVVLAAQRQWEAALRCHQQSESLARRLGAAHLLSRALAHQARALAGAGAGERAGWQCLAARVHAERLGDRRGRAACDKLEGIVCRERALAADAAALYAEAQEHLQRGSWAFGELGDRFEEGECELELGLLERERGDVEEARRRWLRAAGLFSRIGATGGARRVAGLLAALAA